MRELQVWGMTAILGLGLAAHSVAVAGDEEPKKPSRSWLGRWFAPPIDTIEDTQEAINKKNDKEDVKKDAEPRDTTVEKETQKQNALLKAQEDYFRREKVLDKLSQFAMESGDQELTKRIETLTERTWKVYQKKTGASSATGNGRTKSVAALSDRGVKP